MSKRVFFANFSVDAAKNSLNQEEADSAVKSIFSSAVTHLQLRVSFFSMSTKLHQEVFILQARVAQQSV